MTEPAAILNSETRLLNSERTGRQYRITISLPWGYDAQPGENWPFHNNPQKWPVVYVLDGNWYAGMVTDMIRPVALCGGITDAIVVGIGYPEDPNPRETFRTVFTRRDHDLTPIPDAETQQEMETSQGRSAPNGDAANFLKFIQQELIPLIETDFRADPKIRILAGHSYGGLFGLFTLFTEPTLFQKMILGSPYLAYGNRYLFQQEEAFAAEHKQLPARIFLYASAEEESADDSTLTDTVRLAAILQSRNYEGFKLKKKIFENENHCAVIVPGFHSGLQFTLKK